MEEHNPTAAAAGNPDPPPAAGNPEASPAAGEVGASAPSPPDPAPTTEVGAAREREQWFRDRFEREHQVTLAMMRLLLAGLSSQSRPMRFWRWLIDDFRSERRIL